MRVSPGWAEFMALEMSEALDTMKSVAKAGLAVASNNPTAKADKVWLSLRRDKDGSFDIGGLAFGKADSISDQGLGG